MVMMLMLMLIDADDSVGLSNKGLSTAYTEATQRRQVTTGILMLMLLLMLMMILILILMQILMLIPI